MSKTDNNINNKPPINFNLTFFTNLSAKCNHIWSMDNTGNEQTSKCKECFCWCINARPESINMILHGR